MKTEQVTQYNTYLFHDGKNFFSHRLLGAHPLGRGKQEGFRFITWAPHAKAVFVAGDFNQWQSQAHSMEKITESGLWSLSIPQLQPGQRYKYEILTREGKRLFKADPYASLSEPPPGNASVLYAWEPYAWQDGPWMQKRKKTNLSKSPFNIFEVHLGSWRRSEADTYLSYRQLAEQLTDYVQEMGYTHVELLPLTEHPFDGSWGYQTTGYFAPTHRYGTPNDFKYFVDRLHQAGIGVILDWVPGHFCKDDHGLRRWDGEPVYEPEDPLRAENLPWGTLNFDYGKAEVRSFLTSSVLFWLEEFHLDGIRVDAVAQMLYLDFGKEAGGWRPNALGGRENLEAMVWLQEMNQAVKAFYPEVVLIAEESSQWPGVSRPVAEGGLGFDYKWNMGWMNDTLRYMETSPEHRKWHHNLLTFAFLYTYSEQFILPLSHDEVVHGKKSLLDKMPGDYWQKFAGLRAYYGYMMAHPGKKLLFMGGEFGQFIEWNEQAALDWLLLDYEMHQRLRQYVRDLNLYYRETRALWLDHEEGGFRWIDPHNQEQSVVTYLRQGRYKKDQVILISNFTPQVRSNYRIGVPAPGWYREALNSDLAVYGGSGIINAGRLRAEKKGWHQQPYSITLTLPPLSTLYLVKD